MASVGIDSVELTAESDGLIRVEVEWLISFSPAERIYDFFYWEDLMLYRQEGGMDQPESRPRAGPDEFIANLGVQYFRPSGLEPPAPRPLMASRRLVKTLNQYEVRSLFAGSSRAYARATLRPDLPVTDRAVFVTDIPFVMGRQGATPHLPPAGDDHLSRLDPTIISEVIRKR